MLEKPCDLSVVVISHQAGEDWGRLLPALHSALQALQVNYELLTADPHGLKRESEAVETNHSFADSASRIPYGALVRAAVQQATGEYILTMDSDQPFPAEFIAPAWQARGSADIVVGSRYVGGGNAAMPALRVVLSRLLNFVFSRGLDLRVRDMSSAFRLYKSSAVRNLATESSDYDILQDILVRALMMGYQIREIPLRYRSSDLAYDRAVRFGSAYLRTFARLWKARNSIASADYDARAYDALMPPQRYWQRQRYRIITQLLRENGHQPCLDVGCGSSRIIGALPAGSLALDILLRKLRYARRFGCASVQGSIFSLPVPSACFPCVLCSQVIEHVPRAHVLDELDRVLQPGGFLILGTPDYGHWQWLLIEWLYKVLLPQAYADEHITHYTYAELVEEFVSKRGYRLDTVKYILQGELIFGLRKPAFSSAGGPS